MASDPPILFVPVGTNPARLFGMDARERACRLATNAGFESSASTELGRPALLASMAYAWDPAWLKAMRTRPRTILTLGGKPVMAHVDGKDEAGEITQDIESGRIPAGYGTLAA